jgi:hypothetical protein
MMRLFWFFSLLMYCLTVVHHFMKDFLSNSYLMPHFTVL